MYSNIAIKKAPSWYRYGMHLTFNLAYWKTNLWSDLRWYYNHAPLVGASEQNTRGLKDLLQAPTETIFEQWWKPTLIFTGLVDGTS